MQRNRRPQLHLKVFVAAAFLALSPFAGKCQSPATDSSSDELAAQLKSLVASVSQLQSQVQALGSQMTEMRTAQQQSLLEAEQLRAELNRTREQLAAKTASLHQASEPAPAQPRSSSSSSIAGGGQPLPDDSLAERISKLEDEQGLMNDKIIEQSQTKVES